MFKRSGVWWTCIRHNGRKIQKSLETTDKRLAQAIESKVRVEIIEGSYFEKLVGRNKTFKDMARPVSPAEVHARRRAPYNDFCRVFDPFGEIIFACYYRISGRVRDTGFQWRFRRCL